MADPISEYQAKLEEFNAATAAVEAMVKIVAKGASDLRYWQRVMVSNDGGFPGELLHSQYSIDARAWPTGEQIGRLLSGWHSLRFEAQQAYRRIPDAQRKVIQPPPD